MKKYYFTTIAVLFVAFFGLVACDKIEDPIETDVFTEFIIWEEDSINVVYDENKHVLFFDFTSHRCTNCPEWGIWVQDYSEAHNDRVSIVSLHAGFLAPPLASPFNSDLRTDISNAYYNYYGVESNPLGVVDHYEFECSPLVKPGDWQVALDSRIAEDFSTGIFCLPRLQGNRLSTIIKIKAFTEPIGKYKAVALLVGDTICAQKNGNPAVGPSPDWLDYHHHNVAIAALNGEWGTFVTQENNNVMVLEQEYTLSPSFTVPDGWLENELKVITYVYDADTKEVFQAIESEVIKLD